MKNTPEMKEKIVNAAIEEFGNKGLKFTMDDIAKNLGMSKKTLYAVYNTKEEMFLDVADYCFADIKKSEQDIMNDESMDTITKIREIMSVMPEKYRDRGLSNLYLLKDKFPTIYTRVASYLSTDWDATIELLERGMDEGVIRRVPIPIIKSMVESTLAEFMGNDVLIENGISYEDAMDEMIDIIINGIKVNK
jgi:AcrR family transcriptional regulator